MTEQDRLKADIEATRAELAETADALATKLDVKAQAERKVQGVRQQVSSRYAAVRDSAPPPVRKVLGAGEQVVARAAKDKRATVIVLASTVTVVIVVRRVGPVAVRAGRSRWTRAARPVARGHAKPLPLLLPAAAARASRRRSRRRR